MVRLELFANVHRHLNVNVVNRKRLKKQESIQLPDPKGIFLVFVIFLNFEVQKDYQKRIYLKMEELSLGINSQATHARALVGSPLAVLGGSLARC